MKRTRDAPVPIGRRRTLRSLAVVAVGGLAGCGGTGTRGTSTASSTTMGEGPGTSAAAEVGGTGTGGDAAEGLDLREANVVDVEVEAQDGAYRFAVTLYHDDDGEDGYADWWQVESTDGEQFGRRELLHAHGTTPFTRSGTTSVPDGVTCVVVRGHDQTHGYGGQAMLVNLESGATASVRQGSDRGPVDPARCP